MVTGAARCLKPITSSKRSVPVRVLDDVSLTLEKGEVHAILGENGAGKSTLMKLLSGYLKPTEGTLTLDGREVSFRRSRDAEAQGVVLIHQEINLADDLTVEENIFLGVEHHRGPFVRGPRDAGADRHRLERTRDPGPPPYPRQVFKRVTEADGRDRQSCHTRDVRVLLMDEPHRRADRARDRRVVQTYPPPESTGRNGRLYLAQARGGCRDRRPGVSILRDGRLITTQRTSELTQDEMASLMVGRELSDMYPPKRTPGREVVFAAEDVSVPGWAEGYLVRAAARRGLGGLPGSSGRGRTELFEGHFRTS